ncbi:MAG TPA: hypothetical protein PKK06_00780 [Phycisphaerae bacterium]|nr:hypothetical protein [Phycisphaerae bacterium]HNU43857.1 hypothetical protein [Phycisphaerae bacterium]
MAQWCTRCAVVLGAALLVLCVPSADAWYAQGHARVTEATVAMLPDAVPAFFRDGATTIGIYAAEPDLLASSGLAALSATEGPEHFLDHELLGGAQLPATRYEFIALCARKELEPAKVGMLPYALLEAGQRLTFAFAEHRRWPDDPQIRNKCLLYAGLVAHYAQDLCQPLHTTVHYDGRAKPDGTSPQTGIHAKVDALLEHSDAWPYLPGDAPPTPAPTACPSLWSGILEELQRSHALVERVYELEAELPTPHSLRGLPMDVAAFAQERFAAGARFTATVFVTAWRDSAEVKLPDWHPAPRQRVVPPMPMPQPLPPQRPQGDTKPGNAE